MPPKPSSGSVGKDMSVYWEKVFSYRAKTTTNVQETTVSEMLRIIFPEFRLKIIRHFHGTAKMNTTTTIGYLIAAAKMQPVRNIVEGTELLSDLTEAILNGEGDEHFDVTTCEELHQLVAAMVTVEKDMMAGFVSPLHMAAVCDLPLAVSFLIDNGASTETVDTVSAISCSQRRLFTPQCGLYMEDFRQPSTACPPLQTPLLQWILGAAYT